jgi:hypothetical protein
VTGGAEGWAEAVGIDAAQRTPRTDYVPGGLVAAALEPIVATIATAVHEMLSEIPAGLAEDVVRGKRTRCAAWSAAPRRSWSGTATWASTAGPACGSYRFAAGRALWLLVIRGAGGK